MVRRWRELLLHLGFTALPLRVLGFTALPLRVLGFTAPPPLLLSLEGLVWLAALEPLRALLATWPL